MWAHLLFCHKLRHLQFLFGLFQKSKIKLLFWGKIGQNFCEKLEIFPWNLFSCLTYNQFQCIWALEIYIPIWASHLTFQWQITVKFHFSAWTKVSKKIKNKNCFSHLNFLTCYGKQTCFLFWPYMSRWYHYLFTVFEHTILHFLWYSIVHH